MKRSVKKIAQITFWIPFHHVLPFIGTVVEKQRDRVWDKYLITLKGIIHFVKVRPFDFEQYVMYKVSCTKYESKESEEMKNIYF